MAELLVNGFDLSNLGFRVSQINGTRGGVANAPKSRKIPGRAGLLRTSLAVEMATRTIIVNGTVTGTTIDDLNLKLDAIKFRLTAGWMLEVTPGDLLDSYFVCLPVQIDELDWPVGQVIPKADVQFRFECFDPYRYSTNLQMINLSVIPQPVPLGSAPSAPIVQIGNVTNPVVTFRNLLGGTTKTMGFTITLASTDWLEVDCNTMLISKYVAGVKSSVPTVLTSGNFIILDPSEGDGANNQWPTIEVTGGVGVMIYKKAWI